MSREASPAQPASPAAQSPARNGGTPNRAAEKQQPQVLSGHEASCTAGQRTAAQRLELSPLKSRRGLLDAEMNPWLTQTSPTYIAKRLNNYRIPRTPKEVIGPKEDRPSTPEGNHPRYLVADNNGHLLPQHKKPGRTAFVDIEPVGKASWAFTPQSYI
eukprot:CAMPEP_0114543748 /NCGR_PEP_ID=MMETSP0114-20121206/2520_1 /TAXON_ID=31324 /ORGANISM="Goniomonas sp, Strain m" /LENGTH=157 /DNA_ID=CAMNT_0001728105 /DNA_START=25 /DNA_END=498 /DNA_ORIENTATION=-